MRSQKPDPPPATGPEDGGAPWGGLNEHGAAIFLVRPSPGEAGGFEGVHNAAHRGRTNLLGGGQIIQGNRPSEDNHRKRRQPGRTYAAGGILRAYPPQYVDSGAVQAVGDLFGVAASAHVFIFSKANYFLDKRQSQGILISLAN